MACVRRAGGNRCAADARRSPGHRYRSETRSGKPNRRAIRTGCSHNLGVALAASGVGNPPTNIGWRQPPMAAAHYARLRAERSAVRVNVLKYISSRRLTRKCPVRICGSRGLSLGRAAAESPHTSRLSRPGRRRGARRAGRSPCWTKRFREVPANICSGSLAAAGPRSALALAEPTGSPEASNSSPGGGAGSRPICAKTWRAAADGVWGHGAEFSDDRRAPSRPGPCVLLTSRARTRDETAAHLRQWRHEPGQARTWRRDAASRIWRPRAWNGGFGAGDRGRCRRRFLDRADGLAGA